MHAPARNCCDSISDCALSEKGQPMTLHRNIYARSPFPLVTTTNDCDIDNPFTVRTTIASPVTVGLFGSEKRTPYESKKQLFYLIII